MQRLLNKARDAAFYPNEKPRFARLALQSSHLTARVTAKPRGHPLRAAPLKARLDEKGWVPATPICSLGLFLIFLSHIV